MIKKIVSIMAGSMLICCLFRFPVYASDNAGEEYITISVDAADDNGKLKYAIDTDDPSAFSESNEFVVPAGTSHTIYVKDAAGNVTSQVYGEDAKDEKQNTGQEQEEEQKINIDLEIGDSQAGEAGDDEYSLGDSSEPGSASVASKIKTDGSDSGEKVFYTFTTKEGEVLYLVIDQGQGTDNVYLLDTVSLDDLRALADGQQSFGSSDKEEDNLLSALTGTTANQEDLSGPEQEGKKTGSPVRNNAFIILIFAAVGGAAYYYLKVYKNKKNESMDAMDAMDLDEFEPEDEEEDEVEFDYDDAEKEKYLEQLIAEDEALYNTDPEEYAMSHMDESENDAGLEEDEFYSEEDGEYDPEYLGEE